MDEDLKIVLAAELEADESASAQRIAAQLPSIAKLINNRSTIKVGVALDESTIQAQTQKLTQQITRATKIQDIGVSLSLNQNSVNKIRTELNNLKVNPDISRAMTDQLDRMGVQIDKISGRWEAVNGQQERMLNLTIQGTDQMGRTVTYLQTYDTETGNINTHLTNVTANLEKQRNIQEQLARQVKADNESRVSYLKQQITAIEKLRVAYTDPNGAKPIVYDEDLDKLNEKYNVVIQTIGTLGGVQGKLSAQAKDDLSAQIAEYEKLATTMRNAEYVATTLRTKTGADVNAEQINRLAEYESKLRSSGKLTEKFSGRISDLRQQLSTAFDSQSLTAYLNQFDRLKSEVSSFDSQIAAINSGFKNLTAAKNAVFATKGKMTGLDTDSVEYEKLNELLASQVAHQKEISKELGKQVAQNPALLQYASEYQEYLHASAKAAAELAIQEGRVKDAVNGITVGMKPMSAVVQNIETRFKSLNNAPEELAQKVRSLKELMNAVSNAKNDSDKVAAYQKLKEAISGCNKEITQLIGVQNSDLRNFRFAEGLEKAKADLATVERQWSALKSDPGLNDQLRILKKHLNDVQDPVALKKWTAEFGRFKSEVKAAGKNTQSFMDLLKNNISKVAQWGLATISIYDVFNRLKSAVNIVVELDTAMIDLRKTTDETDAAYKRFYLSANDTAKRLGVTTAAIISQTAEWSRLGYSMAEAAKMAEDSAIFAAISPELNTEEATDGLISIMKAFGYEADEVLDSIISKINKVGKRIAQQYSNVLEESSCIG